MIIRKPRHSTGWTTRRRIYCRLVPRLLPGKHRFDALLDWRPGMIVTNPAAFTRWAAEVAK